MDNDVVVAFQELELSGGGVDADVDLSILEGDNTGSSLQDGLEDDLVNHAGSIHALGVGAPVVLILDENRLLAFGPGLELILAGTDEPRLFRTALPGSLGLDDHGTASQGGEEVVGVSRGMNHEGLLVTGFDAGEQTQVAGGGSFGRHGHLEGVDAVFSSAGSAVAEFDAVKEVEHEGVVVFPLPGLGDLRAVDLAGSFLLSRVHQVDQALMGQRDAVVVDLVVLGLGIQVVDILSRADGKGLLGFASSAGSGLLGSGAFLCCGCLRRGALLAAAGDKAENHDDRQQQRNEFLHSFTLLFWSFDPVFSAVRTDPAYRNSGGYLLPARDYFRHLSRIFTYS